jgi:hypothetical protein
MRYKKKRKEREGEKPSGMDLLLLLCKWRVRMVVVIRFFLLV